MALSVKQLNNYTEEFNRLSTYNKDAPTKDTTREENNRRMKYKYFSFGELIKKFSYCCEPKAIVYPIQIVFQGNGTPQWFQIGKTGMFEAQTEEFKDINDPESEILIIQTPIQAIYIPYQWRDDPAGENPSGFNFTLEYVLGIPDP